MIEILQDLVLTLYELYHGQRILGFPDNSSDEYLSARHVYQITSLRYGRYLFRQFESHP